MCKAIFLFIKILISTQEWRKGVVLARWIALGGAGFNNTRTTTMASVCLWERQTSWIYHGFNVLWLLTRINQSWSISMKHTFEQLTLILGFVQFFEMPGLYKNVFSGPKRGWPTPGFSIFIRSIGRTNRPTNRRTFVSFDQILVPTHSLRDKGTKGQRDKDT